MLTDNAKRSLLIIDDDTIFCDVVSQYFSEKKIRVLVANTGTESIKICSRQKVEVVLLDQKLPDVKGVDLCPSILKHNDQAKIIFITAYPSFDNAIEALKAGAHDYLSKPFEVDELELAVNRSLRILDLEQAEQIQQYKERKESKAAVIIGRHGDFAFVRSMVDLSSSNSASVLITGETGTGKSLVAKSIHYKGPKRRAAFISVNCASIPESLIEAELFGHEKGAFTGAVTAKKGLFEMAEGGTLFLDEMGALPLHLQSKLLGVLDDKKIKRLGGESIKTVDVRIIAATNIEINNAVKEKTFREDLYYRLSLIRIHVPPLRERRQDIPELCHFFVQDISQDPGLKLSDSEIARLMEYDWPGNVRELRNIIERSIILKQGSYLRPSELLEEGKASTSDSVSRKLETGRIATLAEMEKNHIKHTLSKLSNNHSRTARALGIARSTLKRKIETYGLD